LLKQKVTQKVAIILGYFILSKNHNEPSKVAQGAKKSPNLVTLFTSKFVNLCKHSSKLGHFSGIIPRDSVIFKTSWDSVKGI
jgi:hypothetical protein